LLYRLGFEIPGFEAGAMKRKFIPISPHQSGDDRRHRFDLFRPTGQGDTLKLDIDPRPTGVDRRQPSLMDRGRRLTRFKRKYETSQITFRLTIPASESSYCRLHSSSMAMVVDCPAAGDDKSLQHFILRPERGAQA
jgi:hypothetical protein